MLPKLSFRYGLGIVGRCGLLLWTVCWITGLAFVIRDGSVNVGQPGGGVTYSRVDAPFTYWTVVGVMIAVCMLGFFLTFELSFGRDDDSDDENEP